MNRFYLIRINQFGKIGLKRLQNHQKIGITWK